MSFAYPQEVAATQSNEFIKDMLHACAGVPLTPADQQFPFGGKTLIGVAGAGNGGQIGNGAAYTFPAAERLYQDDNLLSVGASTRIDRLASFSTMADAPDDFGDSDPRWVRNVAPGEEIISAIPGGRYGMWSGTSMAAPIVSGVTALLLSVRPINLPGGREPRHIIEEMEESGYEWDCTVQSRGIFMQTSRVDAYCAAANLLEEACYPNDREFCPE
jgi:subtilisin family serine protease